MCSPQQRLFSLCNLVRFVVIILLVALQFWGTSAKGDSATHWTGAAGDGLWSSSGNWSAGVPNGMSDAVIDLPGDYTITVDTNAVTDSLSIGITNGVQTITISNSELLVITVGNLATNAALNLTGGTLKGNFNNTGKLSWTSGTIADAAITNWGQFEFTNLPDAKQFSNSTVVNNGTLTGTGFIYGDGVAAFCNNGQFVVPSYCGFDSICFTNFGTILVSSNSPLPSSSLGFWGGSWEGGLFSQRGICRAETNKVLYLDVSHAYFENGCRFEGEGSIGLSGGPVWCDGHISVETFLFTNPWWGFYELHGYAIFDGTGQIEWQDGSIRDDARITVAPGFCLSFSGGSLYGVVTNLGTITGRIINGDGSGVLQNFGVIRLERSLFEFLGVNVTNAGTILAPAGTGGQRFECVWANCVFSDKSICRAETNSVLGLEIESAYLEDGAKFTGDGQATFTAGRPIWCNGMIRVENILTIGEGGYPELNGVAKFTGPGFLNWRGTFGTSAQITLASDFHANLAGGLNGVLTNNGVVTGPGYLAGQGGGVFYNNNMFIVNDGCTFQNVSITNRGTILATADSWAGWIENYGSGILSHEGICRTESRLGLPRSYLKNGSAFTGPGTIFITGFHCEGTILVDATVDTDPETHIEGAGTNTFIGAGTLNVTCSLDNFAQLTLGPGFHMNINYYDYYYWMGTSLSGTINNNGMLTCQGLIVGADSAKIHNAGLMSLLDGTSFAMNGSIENDLGGVIESVSGSNNIAWAFTNSGTVQVDNGNLNLTLSYGPSVSAEQSVVLGGYNSLSDFGQLTSGAFSANGSLTVVLTNDFIPTNGSSFVVMGYPSHSGHFTSTHFPTLPQNLGWNVDLQAMGLVLSVGQKSGILEQPQGLSVDAWHPAIFSVLATNVSGYQWRFDGADIAGATAASYSIASVEANDAGTYSVIVSNSFGTITSSDAVLTVLEKPQITSQPANATNYFGETASFHVAAIGAASISYQWTKNGSDIPGAVLPEFAITNVQLGDVASYSVIVSNQFGVTSSQIATLTVLTTNIPGLFNTGVDDTGVALTAGATDHHYILTTALSSTLPFVGRDNTWVATNSVSAWITPLLASGLPAPTATVTNIYRLTFDLSALDPASVCINGNWSSDNDGMAILINGINTGQARAGNAPDVFTPFSISNGFIAGLNTVDFKVRNTTVGTMRTPTGLRVEFSALAKFGGTAPTITVPPKLFSSGGPTGLLQVIVTGSAPLHYQWRVNGVALSNCTNASVSVTPLLAASAYDVVVSNAFGSVTSSSATLVTKSGDLYRPSVSILIPRVNERLTNILSTPLSGTATDAGGGVAAVLYRLNGAEFEPALGTTNWTAHLSLVPGTNKVNVKALDHVGNESPIMSRTFFAVIRSQFHLTGC